MLLSCTSAVKISAQSFKFMYSNAGINFLVQSARDSNDALWFVPTVGMKFDLNLDFVAPTPGAT